MNPEDLRKQFKLENPQTIGETDKIFDDGNYIDWLEQLIIENCIPSDVLIPICPECCSKNCQKSGFKMECIDCWYKF